MEIGMELYLALIPLDIIHCDVLIYHLLQVVAIEYRQTSTSALNDFHFAVLM